MAAEQITQDITLPDEPPSSRDRVNFRPRADTFVAWMKTFATQIASLIPKINTALTWINDTLVQVNNNATTALNAKDVAVESANNAASAALVAANNASKNAVDSVLSLMNASVSSAEQAEQNAQDAATTATQMAERAEAVVIPTGATYNLTQLDTRNTMMSKAAFNALAAERRVSRAGSGFDEWGKHNATITTNIPINEGMWTMPTIANNLFIGAESSNTGTSKTSYPYINVNGCMLKITQLNSIGTFAPNDVTLPPAPTVYPYNLVMPYGTTLTQEQIDSGWTVSVDSSNSGLIANGTFTTDTSGWTANNGATLSIIENKLRITVGSNSNGSASQSVYLETGTYTLDFDASFEAVDSYMVEVRQITFPYGLIGTYNIPIVAGMKSYTYSFTNPQPQAVSISLRGSAFNVLLFDNIKLYKTGATLTPTQIATGAIKHADSSNSGLIVNGKFTTDTSGWVANTSILARTTDIFINGSIRVTNNGAGNGGAYQSFTTIIGKKYIIECNADNGTGNAYLEARDTSINGTQLSKFDGEGYITLEFTAISTTSLVGLRSVAADGTYCTFDNIAVFPADAISRSDLVFLESWHEDVSEKDFVYPLGNVQYLGTTGDSGTPVAGAFVGSATYSLFGNWQSDSTLVGKGYVWSTLSDANKKAFVANPENNCYLDGDKVIQVRYRVRVVAGMGDSWDDLTNTYSNQFVYSSLSLNAIIAKGKNVSIASELGSYTKNTYFTNVIDIYGQQEKSIGAYTARNYSGSYIASGYDNKCYALPIALVHRRNQGGYDATYNLNGARTMTMTPTCIADCFNQSNYNASTGYIGTSTSRPDGLFYDQVSVEDFKPSNKGADLRTTTKKRTAQSLIEEFAPKVIAGTLLYNNNDTTALTTYKDHMEVRDTSGNRYLMKNKVGNVVTINDTVANKKGFSIVVQNGKQYLQVADDAASDATVQMNLSVTKYDLGVFDA